MREKQVPVDVVEMKGQFSFLLLHHFRINVPLHMQISSRQCSQACYSMKGKAEEEADCCVRCWGCIRDEGSVVALETSLEPFFDGLGLNCRWSRSWPLKVLVLPWFQPGVPHTS